MKFKKEGGKMIKYEEGFSGQEKATGGDRAEEIFEALKKEKETGVSGYYTLPEDSQAVLSEIETYMKDASGFLAQIDTIAVIGIGGSSLGTKAVHAALESRYPHAKRMVFLENPDPVSILKQFSRMKKDNTLFIVVSKSGSTIETTSIFKAALQHFALDLSRAEDTKRIMAITDRDSPLDRFADAYGIRRFHIPDNVGGRFSVLSSVGVVPLRLAGYDVAAVLQGAAAFGKRFFEGKENHLLHKAVYLTENRDHYPVTVLFSYGDCLENFTKWFVQLWGESLGKRDAEGNRTGLTPVGHIGSVDQHSFLQLIIDGVRDKTVTFIKIDNFDKALTIPDISLKHIEKVDYVNGHTFNELIDIECDATKESLIAKDIPVTMIEAESLSEFTVGELILYFEILTSACGIGMHIDTYNQPGVELGKRILVKKFTQQ